MNDLIFRPAIFDRFPEVKAAHSLRSHSRPGDFSMRHGADDDTLAKNRTQFAELLSFEPAKLMFPRLEHSDGVFVLDNTYSPPVSLDDRPIADAVITDARGWLIGVTVADCAAIIIYDPSHRAVGVVHSGWRGSKKNVVKSTIDLMRRDFDCQPRELFVYVSPTPARNEYEVEHKTVSIHFDPKYSTAKDDGKDWFDNKAVVYDQLIESGIPANQIELDPRSNISDLSFHSFRRDGKSAGRSLVAIGLSS